LARLIVIGELDLSGVATVEGCVDALVAVRPRPSRVMVDLHELRFVDVVGVRTLVKACWRLRRVGTLEVLGIQPSVQRVLDLAGLTLFTVGSACDRARRTPARPGRDGFDGY
jgi:anti-anti-sigma factor